MGLTARASAGLRTSEAAFWLDTLDDELANLRVVSHWCLEADAVDSALWLLSPLYLYAWSRMPAEVSDWAEVACNRAAADRHPALPAALAVAAIGAWRRGDLQRARGLAERATAAHGPPGAVAHAFEALGDTLLLEGRPDEAMTHYRAASAHAGTAGDDFCELMYAADIALARGYAGDPAAGVAADQVCVRATQMGAPLLIAWAHFIAGEARLNRAPAQALPHLRKAAQIAQTLGDRFTATAATLSATSIQARLGDPRAALADLAQLVEAWHRVGSWNPTWVTIRLCVEVFVRLEEYEAAGRLLGALQASATAGPAYGTDAARLATAEATLRSWFGNAPYETLGDQGAALGDDGALALARRTLNTLAKQRP